MGLPFFPPFRVTLDGGEVSSNGEFHFSHDGNVIIVCGELTLSYEGDEPDVDARLDVLWRGKDGFAAMASPDNVTIHVFKCERMTNSCQVC